MERAILSCCVWPRGHLGLVHGGTRVPFTCDGKGSSVSEVFGSGWVDGRAVSIFTVDYGFEALVNEGDGIDCRRTLVIPFYLFIF